MDNQRLTMRDLRSAQFCASGVRDFCQRHNLNYKELLSQGLPFAVLEPLNDAMVNELIQRLRNGR